MRHYKVAAAQYPIDRLSNLDAYEAKIADWVDRAASEGAKLLVFPEYGAVELTALSGDRASDLRASIEALDRLMPEIDSLHQSLARRHDVHILAASAPIQGGDGLFRNVARLFAPCGKTGRQEKIMMTRFERDTWGIVAGGPITVFRTTIGVIGVSICYDVEFPLIARAQAEAGAEIILAPSCTETVKGYWRVRNGSAARAVENQCYVVHAPTVGAAPWSPAVTDNHGAAAIYGPPDRGFPDDGVVAIGTYDVPSWVMGDVDLDKVAAVRADGDVLNFRHWAEQGVVTAPLAETVDLTPDGRSTVTLAS
ncbi:carbon-nitrogen hydrolase family protein [Chthonobacter rhizosphaerae]|uniref:carbon-nitrogen hydrolase family protein n=1 Tax=Chthonobacter rhizosphaerae TaxID=2735553 RepID=UPI0015EEBEFA|nr:carbon-nitrogen hydrolase family protein [Chthonobacter rhizosphaerae]